MIAAAIICELVLSALSFTPQVESETMVLSLRLGASEPTRDSSCLAKGTVPNLIGEGNPRVGLSLCRCKSECGGCCNQRMRQVHVFSHSEKGVRVLRLGKVTATRRQFFRMTARPRDMTFVTSDNNLLEIM